MPNPGDAQACRILAERCAIIGDDWRRSRWRQQVISRFLLARRLAEATKSGEADAAVSPGVKVLEASWMLWHKV